MCSDLQNIPGVGPRTANYLESIGILSIGDLKEKDPEDLESLFNLTTALAIKNQKEEVLKTLKTALDKGLPFSRFLAGPRDILKPLTSTPEFQKLKQQ